MRLIRWRSYEWWEDWGYPFRLVPGRVGAQVSEEVFDEMRKFCDERDMTTYSMRRPTYFQFEREQDRLLFLLSFSDAVEEEP